MRMTASWFRSPRISRIQVCGAKFALDGRAPLGTVAAIPLAEQERFPEANKPAAVLVAVKGKSLRDAFRPPLTATLRSGQRKLGRDEEMVAGGQTRR
jgi:hypothetical protein